MTAPAERPPGNGDSSSSTADRFRLTGPSLPLDPRIHAWRRDVADIALAGKVIAPHYARPMVRGCGSRATLVRPGPEEGEAVSELLPGEEFAVLEFSGGLAWGYCLADHVVGYVEAIELTDPAPPSHIVCEKCAPVSADERITSPVLASLPMGARLHGEEHGACLSTEYGCVPLSHLRRIGDYDSDPVIVAERLIGSPYLPGGRSFHGIDGPGLVQLALGLCGVPAPRLADKQKSIGRAVPESAPLRRGDIVTFDGEAGLMVDDLMMIHACAANERVAVEPLSVVERRMESAGARRRIDL